MSEKAVDPEDSVNFKDKAVFLQEILVESIAHVRHNRQYNQRRAARIKVATIVLAGSATILLGLQIAGAESWLKQLAFILGATATMLTALEPYFNYRALWVEHELALARLHRVKADLDFYLKGKAPEAIDSNALEGFHARHQAAWEDLSAAWIGYRRSKDTEGK